MSGSNKPETWAALIAGTIAAFASSVSPALADTVPHDEIDRFGTSNRPDFVDEYWPVFGYGGGCFPYMASDEDGNQSGGLSPTGEPDGDCSDPGQGTLCVRYSETYRDWFGVSNGSDHREPFLT